MENAIVIANGRDRRAVETAPRLQFDPAQGQERI